jgi:hypothetical protein
MMTMPIRHILHILAALLLALCGATAASAHDARPLLLEVTEQADGKYVANLRVPDSVEAINRPTIDWPEICTIQQGETGAMGTATTQLLTCETGLRGQTMGVQYAGYNPSLPTLFRLIAADGGVTTQLLPPDELEWIVPEQPSLWQVARDYLQLGIEHIWGGIDHLLFVAGLLLLARSWRRVVLAVTGFTIAHSITLALAVLDLVRLPIAPVEAAIALSILFLAREIVAPHPDGLAARNPILVSSSFGLLHGFGFASALQEVGLPTGELATGLVSFNLGVELGQIVFIVVAFGLYAIVRRAGETFSATGELPQAQARRFAGYALGIPAGFWFIERSIPLLA